MHAWPGSKQRQNHITDEIFKAKCVAVDTENDRITDASARQESFVPFLKVQRIGSICAPAPQKSRNSSRVRTRTQKARHKLTKHDTIQSDCMIAPSEATTTCSNSGNMSHKLEKFAKGFESVGHITEKQSRKRGPSVNATKLQIYEVPQHKTERWKRPPAKKYT